MRRRFNTIALLLGVSSLLFSRMAAGGGVAGVTLTNPITAVQYADAIVIRIDGFDLLRRQYAELRLEVHLVAAPGVPGPKQVYDLSPAWEQSAVIIQKEPGATCQGVLIALRSGDAVILRQLLSLVDVVPEPIVPLTNSFAAIEPGQYMGAAIPMIQHPDLARLAITNLLGPPPRSVSATSIVRRVHCPINYPMIASFNCAALTRQTGDSANPVKRSVYVALKSQLFDQQTGQPTTVAHYLCEVPLNPDWLTLNGTNDLHMALTAADIKVHATTNQYQGWKPFPVTGETDGGLGQITLAVDADGNIYYPNVPAALVRFRVATGNFEIPPIHFDNFMTQCLPPSNILYGALGPHSGRGEWSPNDARYVAPMNLANPARMLYLACFQRIHTQGYCEWAGLFSVPTGSWTDPTAFSNEVKCLVGSWTNAPSFFDTLPQSNSNRRVSFMGWPSVKSYGNTLYLTNYPGTEAGHWRVDIGADGGLTNFGTPATLGADFYDAYAKPCAVKPYNAQGSIGFADYGRLTMTRNQLYYCLTGTNTTSYTGSIELVYDAMNYMDAQRSQSAAFSNILASSGGPSLAPAYLATAIPGEDGQVLGVGESAYYLSRFDVTTNAAADIDKTYLKLDVGNTNVALPMVAGLGPYASCWKSDGSSNWLHIAGYIGLTRLLYGGSGPSVRFAMDSYGGPLSSHAKPCDQGGSGPIKWYRYLVEGVDDRFFVTGIGEANRGGNEYSGGLMSYDGRRRNDTLWTLNYMSRCYDTSRLRTRVIHRSDAAPIQEFCLSGSYNGIYGAASTQAPTNTGEKIFFYAYETNAMKDVYGFSQALFNGSDAVDCMAYSPDRRYLVILRGNRFLTFDPQEMRFVDGRNLASAGTNGFQIQEFSRPDYSLIPTPDNRLLCYVTSNAVTATQAQFIEVGVSPEGRLSFAPYLGLSAAQAAPLIETYGSVFTFLPDLTHLDGSYDLFIGMSPNASKKGTVCRIIEDFVPPRSFEPPRRISVLSRPAAGVVVAGSRPGTTPYVTVCTNGETVILAAPAVADGRAFVRWEDDDGNTLAASTDISLPMTHDLALVAVVSAPPPGSLTGLTHTAGVWSTNRTITVQWAGDTAGNDIRGYGYLFAPVSGASAPTTVMTTGTTAQSTALADGTWWFVVRSIDGSGNWGQSVEVGPFFIGCPAQAFRYQESFESYGLGTRVAGTNGWGGAADAGIVTGLAYQARTPPGYPIPAAAHTRVLHVASLVSNAVTGATNQNVGVDVMMRPARGELPASPGRPVQMALCIDRQGLFHVWHLYDHAGVWTQRWTALGHPPLATTEWVRVSVALDYSSNTNGHTLFRPALNGMSYATPYGAASPTNLTAPGAWYVCANSPGAGAGGARNISVFGIQSEAPCQIDDVVVTTDRFANTRPSTLLMLR